MMAELDILNGFASKIISDCLDITIDAIKKADKDRKSYHKNIQTRIYQVLIDCLNCFTYNKYKKQDKLYDAAERILKEFKCGKDNVAAVGAGLKMLVSDEQNNICQDFLETLCREICKDNNDDLYKEIDLLWKKKESQYLHEEFERDNQNHEETHTKINYVIEGIDNINVKMDRIERYETKNDKILIKNRAEEYAQKWDKNVFLNNFHKRDKKAGINIKLGQLYIDKQLPHYIWGTNDEEESDIEELLREYIVDNDDRKMLLILGQPGIGKSTLISWIMANFKEKKDDIYVYQFASDLKDIDWQGEDILKSIFEILNLKEDKLGNKVFIFDGFDEIHANSNRERILNQIYHKLNGMNYLKQFSLIITCRKNYMHDLRRVECGYITLQVWDEEQINSFCEAYGNVSRNVIPQNTIKSIISNKEILGIPLILYMVLALGISIEENNSLVDIYDKIFSIDGGIYDRCINNLSYGEEHRISSIKKQIYQISQRIAFWMFENEPEKAFIAKDKYEEICDDIIRETSEGNEDIKRDFLISHYFEPIKHCEGVGTDELQFVHRTIYEYFVAVYFFESIRRVNANDKVAGKLGELLKGRRLSNQILEFIKCKFDRLKGIDLPNIVKEIFDIMLQDGMTFHTKVKYHNVVTQERNVFANMLEIVRLWNPVLGEMDEKIITYLQCNRAPGLNLKGISFSNLEPDYVMTHSVYGCTVDLGGVCLAGANLSKANLEAVNLGAADLRGADLREANLSAAILIGASLEKADLERADLSSAHLERADLSETNLKGANLRGAVLKNADLNKVNLNGINLSRTALERADLSRVSLRGADLSEACLLGVNLSGACLHGADLRETCISGVDLRGADLGEAYLVEADLVKTDLRKADLRKADLRKADLRKADLRKADLGEAYLKETDLREANLSGANLREAILFSADFRGAIFDEDQVNLLYKKNDLIDCQVYISETNEIISYKVYCMRKNSARHM